MHTVQLQQGRMHALWVQGKEEALATLRLVLSISNEDHLRVRGEVRTEQQQQAQQGQENRA